MWESYQQLVGTIELLGTPFIAAMLFVIIGRLNTLSSKLDALTEKVTHELSRTQPRRTHSQSIAAQK